MFETQNPQVCEIILLSLTEVFKDILPLYKIDKEELQNNLKSVISKELRQNA